MSFLLAFILFSLSLPSARTVPIADLQKGFQSFAKNGTTVLWKDFRPLLLSNNDVYSAGFKEIRNNTFFFSVVCILRNESSTGRAAAQPVAVEMVWTANRNSPVTGDGRVSLDEEGRLVLTDGGGAIVWLVDIENDAGKVLRMQDSGNLVLVNERNETIWQSFDHPTDTLLEGQNFTAAMRLVASVSETDPSEGGFFLKMQPDGMALYAAIGASPSQVYWEELAGQETGLIVPQEGPIYARMNVNGYLGIYQNEASRVAYIPFVTLHEGTLARRLKVDADGNLRAYYSKQAVWKIDFKAVEDPCLLPRPCGPYGICSGDNICSCPGGEGEAEGGGITNVSFSAVDNSSWGEGCAPAEPLGDCPSNKDIFFLQLRRIDYVFREYASTTNASTLESCEQICANNCSCAAFFYSNESSRCFHVQQPLQSLVQTTDIQNLAFLRVLKSTTEQRNPPLASSSQSGQVNPHKGHRSAVAPVIASIASAIGAIFFCSFGVWAWRKRKEHDDPEEEAFLEDLPGLPPHISYKQLETVTENFRRSQAGGPLGSLYEGVLAGGIQVVARRLNPSIAGGKLTFRSSLSGVAFRRNVSEIGMLRHENLAVLRGFCLKKGNRALLYEFPRGGTLGRRLSLQGESLDWNARLSIALGVARALAFLHEEAQLGHGLLTPDNILLDEGNVPKVCDAGVWKLLSETGWGGGRLLEAGSEGYGAYMAPERRKGAGGAEELVEKGDVYSYGVLLLELIMGRRWSEGELGKVRGGEEEGEGGVVGVGLWCTAEDMGKRPAMEQVVRILEGYTHTHKN